MSNGPENIYFSTCNNTVNCIQMTLCYLQSETDLQEKKEFSTVSETRKQKVDVDKCKMMVFKKRQSEVIDFADSH